MSEQEQVQKLASDKNIKIAEFATANELAVLMNVPVTEIGISGPDKLTRMFSAIFMGDMTSFYLAIEHGVDPEPVEIIEKLKDMLKD